MSRGEPGPVSASAPAPAIECRALKVTFGTKTALDGLDLNVRRGEVFGFLGPNGAGKSTTIKTLLGLVRPQSGEAFLDGLPASDPSARRRIGFLPEEATYYRFLNPMEILAFYGKLSGMETQLIDRRSRELLDRVGLGAVKKKPLSTFSKGMTQKVSLAQCLLHDPDILILDEPTSGLDPLARIDLRDILSELNARGKTIFFSSHELSEVELLCHSVAIVNGGKVIRSGPLDSVLSGRKQDLEKFFIETIRSQAR